MGTRNLTVIIKDGKIRLSQYGQWDGYFKGAGVDFLQFVKDNLQDKSKRRMKYRIEKFAEKVECLESVDEGYYDGIIKMSNGYDLNPQKNSSPYAIPFKILMPQFSRDTGVKVLDVINMLEPYEFRGYAEPDKNGHREEFYRYRYPIMLTFDREGFTEFTNIINLDTQEIYMLTSHEFQCEPLPTCELVENTYRQKCWYKSSIAKLPRISDIKKYKESIMLDYWQRDNGEWVSN